MSTFVFRKPGAGGTWNISNIYFWPEERGSTYRQSYPGWFASPSTAKREMLPLPGKESLCRLAQWGNRSNLKCLTQTKCDASSVSAPGGPRTPGQSPDPIMSLRTLLPVFFKNVQWNLQPCLHLFNGYSSSILNIVLTSWWLSCQSQSRLLDWHQMVQLSKITMSRE